LHEHVRHRQTHHVREQCDPLMSERRICGLRESAEPLHIPWIEPMMSVVRGKEDVRVRIIRTCGQLHKQQRAMYRQCDQKNGRERNRSDWKRRRLRYQGSASERCVRECFDSQKWQQVCRGIYIPQMSSKLEQVLQQLTVPQLSTAILINVEVRFQLAISAATRIPEKWNSVRQQSSVVGPNPHPS
jgi:hypothetical protein